MCENFRGRNWLAGGKGLREPRPTHRNANIFLSWGNRIRWFEAETGQRAGKEGEEVSKNQTTLLKTGCRPLKTIKI